MCVKKNLPKKIENNNMNSYSYLRIVKFLDYNQFHCVFENGETGIFDLSLFNPKEGVFSYLESKENQKNFSIENGILTWNGGLLDIAPENLYHVVTGKSLPYWVEKVK